MKKPRRRQAGQCVKPLIQPMRTVASPQGVRQFRITTWAIATCETKKLRRSGAVYSEERQTGGLTTGDNCGAAQSLPPKEKAPPTRGLSPHAE
jgi:hypothetical protein